MIDRARYNVTGDNEMRMIDLDRIQGASTEVVRDVNRRIVLNLIRTRQPISRATSRSGPSRCTRATAATTYTAIRPPRAVGSKC